MPVEVVVCFYVSFTVYVWWWDDDMASRWEVSFRFKVFEDVSIPIARSDYIYSAFIRLAQGVLKQLSWNKEMGNVFLEVRKMFGLQTTRLKVLAFKWNLYPVGNMFAYRNCLWKWDLTWKSFSRDLAWADFTQSGPSWIFRTWPDSFLEPGPASFFKTWPKRISKLTWPDF